MFHRFLAPLGAVLAAFRRSERGNVAMMCSALHIHGIDHIGRVLAALQYWLEKREYPSLSQTRGCLSRRSVPDVSPFDRGNYIKTLSSYSLRQTVAAF